MIWKNFRKDLAYTATRLLSVIILTAIATMILIGLRNVMHNGNTVSDNYLTGQNVADYWITGIEINKQDIREISNINGVTGVQPRITFTLEDKKNDEVSLAAYAVSDYEMNTPHIMSGTFPSSNREIMISDKFAKEHNLSVGDMLDMKIPSTGQTVKKEICALIKSPETLFHASMASPIPNYYKYGFAYMNEDALSGLGGYNVYGAERYGSNVYNQLCITVSDNADREYIKNQISEILGHRLLNNLALEDNMASYQIKSQMESMGVITIIFPCLFYFVAALIMYSTMTRLIENARMSIGTMKALGYSDRIIMLYYLLYAIIVVVLSFAGGAMFSNAFTKFLLNNAIFAMVDFPPHPYFVDWSAWILSFVLSCLFCIGSAYMVLRRSLNEKPAQCMRPKPPKSVKPVFLERFAFWKKFSFSNKYILRNMFRSKGKMIICVIGVAGCAMLITAALGANDCINNAFDAVETRSHNYDAAIVFNSGVAQQQYRHIENIPSVTEAEYEMMTQATIMSKDKRVTETVTVAERVTNLKLPKTFGRGPVVLPEEGVWMETALAEELGVDVGDTITMEFAGSTKKRQVEISGLSKDSMGVVFSKEAYRKIGEVYSPSSCYVKTDNVDYFLEQALKYDFVSDAKTVQAAVTEIKNQLDFLTVMLTMVIAFAIILEFVVLQNLGTMSFFEQVRNLATLLVLGFHDKEAKKLLLTENIIFAFMGFLVGAPLGVYVCKFLLSDVDMYLEFVIQPISFVIAFILTMGFAVVVNKLLGRKIKTIDMLGALKSVE